MKLYRKALLSLIISSTLIACGGGSSDTEVVEPPVNSAPPTNAVPVASAGSDISINLGEAVTLDGSGSSDDDGDALTYNWQFVSGPDTSSVLDDSATQTFTPSIEGTYEVSLTVSDGKDTSTSDTVVITVIKPNTAPVANAGSDININLGEAVTLDGTGSSDDDGDALTYNWEFVSGPDTSFVFDNLATQTFTPSMEGSYEVSLTVSDGTDTSSSDTVTITVIIPNTAPVASITGSTEETQGNLVELSAESSTDADGDNLTYSWFFDSVPSGSSLTSNALIQELNTSFTPDVAGEYVVNLTVNDGIADSETVSHTISIEANLPPVVNAEIDIDFRLGGEAYFYSSVVDEDSSAFTYEWEITATPEGSELLGTTFDKSYLAYIPDVAGEYTAKVTVTDGYNSVESNEVVATIDEKYEYNYRIGGSTQYVGKVNEPLLIDFATSNSPQGKKLDYSWSLRSGPGGSRPSLTTSIVNKAETEFTGDKAGNYRIFVRMTSEGNYVDTKSIFIQLLSADTNDIPRARTNNPHFIKFGEDISLDGLDSFDAENDLIDLQWNIAYQPPGSNLTIENASNVNQSVSPTLPGFYNIQLKATDEESAGNSYSSGWFYVYENIAKPTALTENNIVAKVNDVITLNGSESAGVDDSITAIWDLINAPYNSIAELSNTDTLNPTFEVDVDGKFVFQLRLLDGEEVVSIEHLIVRATDNATPVANAGDDVSVVSGENVQLSGSLSSDDESDTLTYEWNIVSLSTNSTSIPEIDDYTSENPSIIIDENFLGQIVVGLIVSDGYNTSVRDEVIIDVVEAAASQP